ncbi:bifunctional hydroxymethylpyrimidine kinase/phosphomethylpyrimidine kinase [Lichenibacterium minor]|uniref:hydroxymethylpyrimidine kinase n=1 Tax=Lichenibacterium minor TaxID=2316528 RepID=A0A4Q2U8T3_9HYPH|nr:bifunctional hydroxymethylpyrimidine kinase/phosphomethylpyrimidine kinase [Lichenibacterium minor]RYC33179.1 bifunctional hydroxymethylpyrimidine kinase/phosphomethylpyrimidine kinase [Lichenibacterium minor]
MIPNLLSIAGSDPSGGAGIQADLKTFSALGCYGMAALTALTAQNTRGVSAVHVPPPEFLTAELDAVFADVRVDAVKIGMLATGDMVRAVARCLAARPGLPVVLDPVLVATSGDSLGAPDVVDALVEHLLPLATVITPNLPEAARLSGLPVPDDEDAMRAAAQGLMARGARAVLVKGGHLGGADAVDLLVEGREIRFFHARRIATANTHGTGCTLSSAIACYLARGLALADAVDAAKNYLTGAIADGASLDVGGGHGPVHHFHALWPVGETEVR